MHNTTTQTERSVLAHLRGLVPRRPLSSYEALRIAELQANRLLEHFQIPSGPVPSEIVSELPRIKVVRETNLPISGAAHWDGRNWLITLSADEHPLRQRFSLMHEFKHVIDHTTKHYMYRDTTFQTAAVQAERVADYFAACLLMPKRVVKGFWFQPQQSIDGLAARLRVSPAALRYRLDQLGLTERPPRCSRRFQTVPRPSRARHSLGPAAVSGERQ